MLRGSQTFWTAHWTIHELDSMQYCHFFLFCNISWSNNGRMLKVLLFIHMFILFKIFLIQNGVDQRQHHLQINKQTNSIEQLSYVQRDSLMKWTWAQQIKYCPSNIILCFVFCCFPFSINSVIFVCTPKEGGLRTRTRTGNWTCPNTNPVLVTGNGTYVLHLGSGQSGTRISNSCSGSGSGLTRIRLWNSPDFQIE